MSDEAAIINSLNLGTSREVLEAEPGSPMDQLLVTLMEDVIEQLQQKLVDYNINTSRLGLSQSLVPSVTYKAGEVRVGLSAAFYWKFINSGVNGTEVSHGAPTWGPSPADQSFKQSILEWIPARGVQLPPSFKT